MVKAVIYAFGAVLFAALLLAFSQALLWVARAKHESGHSVGFDPVSFAKYYLFTPKAVIAALLIFVVTFLLVRFMNSARGMTDVAFGREEKSPCLSAGAGSF